MSKFLMYVGIIAVLAVFALVGYVALKNAIKSRAARKEAERLQAELDKARRKAADEEKKVIDAKTPEEVFQELPEKEKTGVSEVIKDTTAKTTSSIMDKLRAKAIH